MPELTRRDDVFVLDLGDGENRVNPAWLDGWERALDTVESSAAPRALVSVGSGKFWSNGLDLDWMGAHPEQSQGVLDRLHALFGRLLGLGAPTVAVVQGHAFAAGAMLAVAHDRVLMRSDRGYWCVPEVDLGLPFTVGMNALLRARLSPATAHEAMTTGRRYAGPEAVVAGIAAAALPEVELLDAALAWAGTQAAKDPATLAAIKRLLYADALAALRP